MERKKVIDDLQDAVNDNWLWRHADYYALTMERAIALLKEQEPVSVYEAKISKCACGNIVNRYYHPKFCGFCGKELMWY